MSSQQSDPDSNAAAFADSTATNGQTQMAASAWTSGLTLVVGLGLGLEVITGLWIFLAAFSVLAQLQVLAHTVAGLLLILPCAIYLWRHYGDRRDQTLSVVKLVGYAAMVFTTVNLVSGCVIAFESFVGPKLSRTWDEVHLVTGIALAVSLALHLIFAYVRRRTALRGADGFIRRFRRRGLAAVGAIAGLCAVLGTAASLVPTGNSDRPIPKDYVLPAYLQKFAEYRGSPFAPTYARTSTGRLVNPAVLANSASCGTAGCHEQILAEWEPSAHRFSAMNPPFLAVQKKFAHERSPADTRYCAGCHDPISLFAGAKDASNMSLSAPGTQEGASCAVCHSISHVDQRGNADYVLTPPTKYIGEGSEGWAKAASDFLIRAYPQQHLADYNRSVIRSAEFCGACHKQFIPEALNRFGTSPSQNQYDEWRKSHWHDADHPEKDLSCRDCHMRLVPNSRDPGAGQAAEIRRTPDDGTHRHHGFIATNLFMPAVLKLPHHVEQQRLTLEWMKGQTVIPEIAKLWPGGPAASIELLAPDHSAPGRTITIQAVVHNRKGGHNFTTGPLDFIRSWIHLRIADADGQVLAEWGGIDPVTRDILDRPGVPHRPSEPGNHGTMVLEAVPLDAAGQPILRHDLWRKAGGTGLRVIFPGYADKQVFVFEVPASVPGPLTVTADLDFRRYRQEFLRLMTPDMEHDSGVYQPTVTMDSAKATISIGAIPGPLASVGQNGKQ